MAKHTRPSDPTIKRLFWCNRRCAFTGCGTLAIDVTDNTVLVEVAHIVGENSTAARHDPSWTPEQLHAFENLMILCGSHHKKIDRHPANFPLETLRKMKAAAEQDLGPDRPPDAVLDPIVAQVAVELQANIAVVAGNVLSGSSAVLVNQGSGVAAHTINLSRPPRRIPQPLAERLAAAIRPYACHIEIVGMMGDGESMRLSEDLVNLFRIAGWPMDEGLIAAGYVSAPMGFHFLLSETFSTESPEAQSVEAVVWALTQAGLHTPPPLIPAQRRQGIKGIKLIVGHRGD